MQVINDKEGFRFYIFYCLKPSENFEMEVFLLIGKWRRNISRRMFLRNTVISQQSLNEQYQPGWKTNQN